MPGGQPPIVANPEEMLRLVEEYFNLDEKKTITGLAIHCGFWSRQSFYDYEKRPEYSYILKKARLLIENQYENKLDSRESATAGVIFALKQLGWKDTQEIEQTVKTLEIPKFEDRQ